MNYEKEYNESLLLPDGRNSHSFTDPRALASQIQGVCGRGSLLDVGCGSGLLVQTLVGEGVDARGVDIAPRPIEEANRLAPGRFQIGSILALPFPNESFESVTTTDCLEHLAAADVAEALKELHRVARRFVFVQLSTKPDRDRACWEKQFFAAGFRRHLLNQLAVPYESLEDESCQITLVFRENSIGGARAISSGSVEIRARSSHGVCSGNPLPVRRSHIARYMLARQYLPGRGGRCGRRVRPGLWKRLLAQSSPSSQVVGIDNSEFATQYAEKNFCPNLPGLAFRQGDVCDLSSFADSSVDMVVSFETVEHLREPQVFLKEVQRALKPGGTFICSVPNLWVDETGKDPNPWHFHVFDFPKLARSLRRAFLIWARSIRKRSEAA